MSFSKCTGKCHHGFSKWSKTCTLQVRKPLLVLQSLLLYFGCSYIPSIRHFSGKSLRVISLATLLCLLYFFLNITVPFANNNVKCALQGQQTDNVVEGVPRQHQLQNHHDCPHL